MVFKPSFSLSLNKKVDIAKTFIAIGGTFLKEDETYLVSKNELIRNAFTIQNAINKISSNGFYVPNITSYIFEKNISQELYNSGIRIVMVNYLINGLPSIVKTRCNFENMLLWGHRVGYSCLREYISMEAMSSLAVYSGIDLIHIGTPFIAFKNDIEKCRKILKSIQQINKKTVPVFTKTSHQIIPHLVKLFGYDIILMACGSLRTSGKIDWNKVASWIDAIKHA
jgi:ribulose 1,5-bisphosphate carboxylase large subunit-like protein